MHHYSALLYSWMIFWPPQNKILSNMRILQVLKVPVQARFSTLAENTNIVTNLTIRRTVGNLSIPPPKLHSLGGNFHTGTEVAVAGGEVETLLIFPRTPAINNSINDIYWIRDPPVRDTLEDQNTNQIEQTVSLHVVSPAPYVIGQSQKKDISPSLVQNEIKCVNDAYCVSHCLCAPNVKNVHHVVRNPPVGGRLQRFLQVWLSLGSNPRVVSILKEGYSLPFKVRPL